MESHRENHQKQVNNLRDEIQQKHDFIQQLKELVVKPLRVFHYFISTV